MSKLGDFCDFMWTACVEWDLGYDQSQRWNVWDGGECDCSSLVITALQKSGFDTGDATYTGNMSDELCARGWQRLDADIGSCRRGDILLNDANHVCAVIDGEGWDATIAQASIDENGRAAGGRSGDQTGRETNIGPVYIYRRGWDCILRYPEDEEDERRRREEEERRRREEEERQKELDELKPVYNNGGTVYRLYDERTGNHLFTVSVAERDNLVSNGWIDEGAAWTASQGKYALYRMYNPGNGDHLLTNDFDEAKAIQEAGWKYEGVPMMISSTGQQVFRMYNPNSGLHTYTTSDIERDSLRNAGWLLEGSFKV